LRARAGTMEKQGGNQVSVQAAKIREKMIRDYLQRVKREVAAHPSPTFRMVILPRLCEIEKRLE